MKYKKVLFIIVILIFILEFLYFENNSIVISYLNIKDNNLPIAFSGCKILQISDLHNKYFAENQNKIMKHINKVNPDIIVITGDIIDRRKYNEEPALNLIKQLTKVYPVYYVTGNHEAWSGKFNDLEKKLIELNVIILRNEKKEIIKQESKINIIGIDDFAYFKDISEYNQVLKTITQDISNDDFTILLSHRPEKIDVYNKYPIDIVFTGHAHGGQIRLPFIGGLYAPNQGILPKYTSGVHEVDDLKMIVNRGLGNSAFPQRLFNRPELVVVTLEKN